MDQAQAIDQWNALVAREEEDAYQVRLQPRSPSSPSGDRDSAVHSCPALWREKICEWCFQVVDHCDIDRDVVSVALSYFDRYLSCHAKIAESLYQLVAMTSLYLAVKLHSTKKISVASMSSLSKGQFRPDQISKMEVYIIQSLNWHLNPPTPIIYLNVADPLLEASSPGDAQALYDVSELSRYLLELSVCDEFFADKRPSSVALAAVAVAMENLSSSSKAEGEGEGKDCDLFRLDKAPKTTELCARRLRNVYSLATSAQGEEQQREGASPASVMQG